jgi:predicted neuraminidase
MLITDRNILRQYDAKERKWQGIPGIEKTDRGRLIAAFYSGGAGEQLGNFVVVCVSDDDGKSWSEPITAVYKDEKARCFDECLWIDPSGRLWLFWACQPPYKTYAAVCDDPDAAELKWSREFVVGEEVMMNKPTVLSSGEWLFPLAVWKRGVYVVKGVESETEDRRAFVYRSLDGGKTFEKLGGADCDDRIYDEHMILEKKDGTLEMYIRTRSNIALSRSADGGKTWTYGEDSGFASPGARFYIGRLASGNILLVNHHDFSGRNNLKAMISDDEGKTFRGFLMIDARDYVSYPDVKQDKDGYIYIVYDRERGAAGYAVGRAGEILLAKVTERDILAGKLVSGGSFLKRIVSKLS